MATQARATRRTALRGAVGLMIGGGLAQESGDASRAAQSTPPASSGGLGLTRAEWEARVGPGEAGPAAGFFVYRVGDLTLSVLFDAKPDERVASIDWITGTPREVLIPDAEARMAQFLPADAALRENFYAPGNGTHPLVLVQLFTSAALKNRFAGRYAATGDIAACYFFPTGIPSEARVVEVNLFVGTRPPALHG